MTFVPVALEPAHHAVPGDIANALRRAGGGPESKGVYTWLIGKTDLIYPTQFLKCRSPDIFPLILSTTPLTELNRDILNSRKQTIPTPPASRPSSPILRNRSPFSRPATDLISKTFLYRNTNAFMARFCDDGATFLLTAPLLPPLLYALLLAA